MRSILLAVVLVSVFVAVRSAHGFTTSPNVVANSGFDASIDSWQLQGQGASLVWSSDIGLPPGSAFMRVEADDSAAQGGSVSQCRPIVAGGYYVAEAAVLLSTINNSPVTVSNVFLDWFAASDCSGAPIHEGDIRAIAFNGPDDQWQLFGVSGGAPQTARAVRVGVFVIRPLPSALPSQAFLDNVSLQHLTADPPAAKDHIENVQVRGQDVTGHVQIRVEVAPNGNYLLHTSVSRAKGNGTFCVGFGFDPSGSGCRHAPWTFSVEGTSKNPLAFSREWIPRGLPCVIVFSDPNTFDAVAHARLNFAGCGD